MNLWGLFCTAFSSCEVSNKQHLISVPFYAMLGPITI